MSTPAPTRIPSLQPSPDSSTTSIDPSNERTAEDEKTQPVSVTESSFEEKEPSGQQDGTVMSTTQEIFFVMSVCLGQLLTLAPLGQVLAPLHIVGASFNETSNYQLSWYVAAYALTLGTFILLGGGLGDRFGFKRLFLIAIGWLALWSFIAAFSVYSKSEAFFDFCRAMQGLGAAILTPNAMAILGATYPPGGKKAALFCLFGSMAPTGFFTTTVIGSVIAELAWWPWTFWIYTLIATVVFVEAFLTIPHRFMKTLRDNQDKDRPSWDWLGTITGPSGLILFNVAWNQAPSVGWSEPYVIVLLILGVLLLVAFVLVERRADAPLVPVRELNSGVLLVLLCIVFGWMSFGIFLYYWFEFVEVVQGHSPLAAAARHVPGLVFALVAAGVVAGIVTRIRSCWIMLGAELAFVTANVLLATLNPETLYWKQLFWTVVIIPFGMDMTYPAASLMLSNMVQEKHQGIAVGLVATVANYAVALGLGVAGTVEVHFNDGGKNVLAGYRSALFTSVGLAGIGLLISIYLVARDYAISHKEVGKEASLEK